jgi:hypothetical protein
MVRNKGSAVLQPPRCNLREHDTFVRNRLRHDHVEGADAIGRDNQQLAAAHGIHIAHFAPAHERKGQRGLRDDRAYHAFNSGV